jgi:hypothetical protein
MTEDEVKLQIDKLCEGIVEAVVRFANEKHLDESVLVFFDAKLMNAFVYGQVGQDLLRRWRTERDGRAQKQIASPWVWLTFAGNPFVVNRNEVTGVAPLTDGYHATSQVVIGMKGQPWSKTCDGSVAEVCAKLGIPLEGQ